MIHLERQTAPVAITFASLQTSNVALLTSFRRNGQGVATPVGIRVLGDKAYFTTWSTTGKVKRITNNPHVTLAPCTRGGKVHGPSVAGRARCLEGADAQRVATAMGKSVWGQLWAWIYKLRGYQPVLYEVAPVAES